MDFVIAAAAVFLTPMLLTLSVGLSFMALRAIHQRIWWGLWPWSDPR